MSRKTVAMVIMLRGHRLICELQASLWACPESLAEVIMVAMAIMLGSHGIFCVLQTSYGNCPESVVQLA